MRLFISALFAALISTTLVSSTASAEGGQTMSQERAGSYYLNGACPHARDEDRYYNTVFGPDNRITKREVRARLPELKRLARALSRSAYAWGRHLLNPPREWPEGVGNLAEQLADRNLTFGGLLRQMSYAENANQWLNDNARQNRFKFGTFASRIRARLDLPPPGEGC